MKYHEKMYFSWLLRKIEARGIRIKDYSLLLEQLFDTEYIWVIERDINRVRDGLDLRYQYGYGQEKGYIMAEKPCSVLEMLVALASRIENSIMSNAQFGDRTGLWFWEIIENMGLKWASNKCFDGEKVTEIVSEIMENRGENDWFCCAGFDFQKWNTMEIWQKMTAWLNENFDF